MEPCVIWGAKGLAGPVGGDGSASLLHRWQAPSYPSEECKDDFCSHHRWT